MKNSKKYLSLILFYFFMALPALAGCGGDDFECGRLEFKATGQLLRSILIFLVIVFTMLVIGFVVYIYKKRK